MTFKVDFLTLLAFLGTFQGILFAVVFWMKNKNISNKLFSLFLLATSIRIAKNVFVHLQELNPGMFQSMEVWRTAVYAGISHQFAIGPLLLFYFRSKLDSKFEWKRSHYFHFIPYFVLIVVTPFINWNFWRYGGLWLSYISILTYFLLTIRCYINGRTNVDGKNVNWLKGLLIVIGVLLFAYSPALFHYIGYVGGAILYAIIVLVSGYYLFVQKDSLSIFRTKYETSSLKQEKVSEIRTALEAEIENSHPYLNPELTLQVLAGSIGVPAHHLSRVINQEFKMSFTDYINSFRLKEAEKRLLDPRNKHLKIAALAFECGFNSVPTFNTFFKKTHRKTPTQFRSEANRSESV